MRTTGILGIALAVALAGAIAAQQASQRAPSHSTGTEGGSHSSSSANGTAKTTGNSASATAAGDSTNHYVDPAWCAQCHADIARTYALTGMGRSFAKIDAATMQEKFPFGQPFFHAPSQSFFSIVESNGEVFERRWQTAFDGKETNVEEKRIDYVLGSGNHGRTYLHLTDRGTLEQLPMGWYSENGGTWAMIPGFDRADYPGSTRQVQYECMFCHNAYPQIPAGHTVEGAEPVYQQPLATGIDCQRCHGPGERHIQTVGKGGVTPEEIRASIVNPGRLGPEREMEVCMQCHLETSSLLLPHSVQRADRTPFSFIAGQPLADFRLSFDRAPGKNTRFEVASAPYRLRQSQCFLQTQSNDPDHRMTCTTCHDPHNIPRGEQATTHYNDVCNQCHATQIKQAISAGSHPTNPDCISCHMPNRRTDDAIHIVMTDHLIQRRPPPNLLAPKREYYESPATSYKGEVVLYYPPKLPTTEQNQLDVAVAQVKEESNLRGGIPELAALIEKYKPANAQYYVDLAEALHAAGRSAQSAEMYQEALRHDPSSPQILLRFGSAQIDWQQWSNAEVSLRRATSASPNDAVAWGLLGQAFFQENKNADAKEALTKAVSLDPDLAEPHNYLGGLLVRANDMIGAESEFREALRIEPNVAQWQANLAGLLASEGRMPEARYLFELSIQLDPKFAGARLNYARLLASTGDAAGAEAQAKAAVDADPKNPDAHEIYGYLLTVLGDGNDAVRELRSAIAIEPTFARAHLDLAVALRMTGDVAGASEQLRIAAQGNDPDVRAEAQQLEKSGR